MKLFHNTRYPFKIIWWIKYFSRHCFLKSFSFLSLPPHFAIKKHFAIKTLRVIGMNDLIDKNQHARKLPDFEWQQCFPLSRTNYLDPAAILVPSLLKMTWFAFVVKRVRMPSGAPSGNVWIWTVLFDTAAISRPF